MKKSDDKITRFEQDGFYIDIVETEDAYAKAVGRRYFEAWLQHKNFGMSTLMFGSATDDFEYFLDLVDKNLNIYIENYYHEVINHDEEQVYR